MVRGWCLAQTAWRILSYHRAASLPAGAATSAAICASLVRSLLSKNVQKMRGLPKSAGCDVDAGCEMRLMGAAAVCSESSASGT